MTALFLALACLSAETDRLIVVKTADQAASLPPQVERLRVVLRDRHDQETLAAVLKHAPNLRSLDLYHPDNGVPLKSIELLTKFPKLEDLRFTGDANLDDEAFAALGKLDRLKSLRMKFPCPSFSEARLALLGGMTALEKLDLQGCRGDHREHERKVWEAVRQKRTPPTEKLQGTWICKWFQHKGQPDHDQIQTLFVFDGAKMTHKAKNGHVFSKWQFKVDSTIEPHGIDWFNAARPSAVTRGILWINDDTLVFCDGTSGERPTRFTEGSRLYVLTRSEPSDGRDAAVAAIEKMGGQVSFDEQNEVVRVELEGPKVNDASLVHLKAFSDVKRMSVYLHNTRVTDAGFVHLKELKNLTSLRFDERLSDAGLAYLKGLTQLRDLGLNSSRHITDTGLEHLRGLTNLESLTLARSKVTDVGLQHLKGLTKLSRLNLYDTTVSDAGLEHLKGLINLRFLVLKRTNVTDVGVEKLKQALPNCRISHSPRT